MRERIGLFVLVRCVFNYRRSKKDYFFLILFHQFL